MARKTPPAEPDNPTPPADAVGLTIAFPAAVRAELLALGQALGLGVRATQDLVASFYADSEDGPARAAALEQHLRLPLTRHHHARELAALKARQAEVEAAQAKLEGGDA